MKRVIMLVMLVLLLSSSLVLADNCPPSPPKSYNGTVGFEGAVLVDDYEIRAVIGIDTVGIGAVSGGNYDFDVSPCMGATGDVKFYINGIKTNEGGSYIGMDDWGINENLDLTVNALPPLEDTCGPPNAIEFGEECDGSNLAGRNVNDCGTGWTGTISCSASCQIDYSNCAFEVPEDDPISPPQNNPGGNNGNPSSNTPDDDDDEVTDLSDEEDDTELETLEDEETETEELTVGTGTGAVVGFFKSGVGIGLIFGIIVIALTVTVLAIQKKKVIK